MPIFTLKPIYIEARQVDVTNLDELAEWCGGNVTFKQMAVELRQVETNRESGFIRADIGDWIIKHSHFHFTVQTQDGMDRKYLEVQS
jgi:hypothetical protein